MFVQHVESRRASHALRFLATFFEEAIRSGFPVITHWHLAVLTILPSVVLLPRINEIGLFHSLFGRPIFVALSLVAEFIVGRLFNALAYVIRQICLIAIAQPVPWLRVCITHFRVSSKEAVQRRKVGAIGTSPRRRMSRSKSAASAARSSALLPAAIWNHPRACSAS